MIPTGVENYKYSYPEMCRQLDDIDMYYSLYYDDGDLRFLSCFSIGPDKIGALNFSVSSSESNTEQNIVVHSYNSHPYLNLVRSLYMFRSTLNHLLINVS